MVVPSSCALMIDMNGGDVIILQGLLESTGTGCVCVNAIHWHSEHCRYFKYSFRRFFFRTVLYRKLYFFSKLRASIKVRVGLETITLVS